MIQGFVFDFGFAHSTVSLWYWYEGTPKKGFPEEREFLLGKNPSRPSPFAARDVAASTSKRTLSSGRNEQAISHGWNPANLRSGTAARPPFRIHHCLLTLRAYLPDMENRYYYLDRDGRVHGPLWLSIMRERWRNGRLMMSTEISLNGADGWQRMEFHPEIFEEEARLPGLKRLALAKKSKPVRLLLWTMLLLLAYAAWVVFHWDDGLRLKLFDDEPPPASDAAR